MAGDQSLPHIAVLEHRVDQRNRLWFGVLHSEMPREHRPELAPPQLVTIGDVVDLAGGSRLGACPHGRSGQQLRVYLVQTPYEDLVAWQFGEFIIRSGFDNVTSTIKARKVGFADCLDTEDRFLELFDRLAANKVIPPLDRNS